MTSDQDNRPAVVLTGASRGIGHATVKRFSDEGWYIITCSRDDIPEHCKADPNWALHIPTDLSDQKSVAAFIEEANDFLKGRQLNALVNNAAVSPKTPYKERLGCLNGDTDRWREVFELKRPNMHLVMDPRGEQISLPGEATVEPTFGLPAVWVQDNQREEAVFRGYTVVDPSTVITTHLTEVLKDNMAELLSYGETQKLLEELPDSQQKLVEDIVPAQVGLGALQRILQNLLIERVSIRDLPTILEGAAEAVAFTRNITQITEHVRSRLSRQLSDANTNPEGIVPLITLSPDWEQAFSESIIGQGDERQLAMAPSQLQDFIGRVRSAYERQAMAGETPVLLVSPQIRPFVRSVVERFRPATVVMSQNEIHPKAQIRTVDQV